MRTLWFWIGAVVIAAVVVACNRAPSSPSAPSANSNSSSSGGVLSPAQQQAAAEQVAAACGVDLGNSTIGNSPPGGTPTTQPGVPGQGPVTVGPGGDGGAPEVVFAGEVTGASGQYPSMTLTLGPQTVRTTGATSFRNVSGSIATGTRLGAAGTIQADQSIAATCVAGL
jgi:Domain of unknown function (DUF5666)